MTPQSIHYGNVLFDFKFVKVNDKEWDRKIIRWDPILLDFLSSNYGSRGTLRYFLHDNTEVPGEYEDPFLINNYHGQSGRLLEELIERLPHEGQIFKNGNATVYMMIGQTV